MQKNFEFSFLICPGKCNSPITLNTQTFEEYFEFDSYFCKKCSHLNAYEYLKQILEENFFKTAAYSVLGGMSSFFTITLSPESCSILELEKYGLPKDAKILSINYTPCSSGLFPLQSHGNEGGRHSIPHKIVLYPAQSSILFPLGSFDSTDDTKVNIMVTWIDLASKDDSYLWDSLLIAVENFVSEKYMQCILPANICIEAKMRSVIESYFMKTQGEEYFKKYCKNDHNFGYHQCLNHMLPLMVNDMKVRPLPDNVHMTLNKLKSDRNNIGHRGRTKKELLRKEVAEYLSAVIIGFNYLFYIENKINSN